MRLQAPIAKSRQLVEARRSWIVLTCEPSLFNGVFLIGGEMAFGLVECCDKVGMDVSPPVVFTFRHRVVGYCDVPDIVFFIRCEERYNGDELNGQQGEETQ